MAFVHETPMVPCPYCSKELSAVSGGIMEPEEGDITVCWYCAGICMFDKELILHKATLADIPMELHHQVLVMQHGIKAEKAKFN